MIYGYGQSTMLAYSIFSMYTLNESRNSLWLSAKPPFVKALLQFRQDTHHILVEDFSDLRVVEIVLALAKITIDTLLNDLSVARNKQEHPHIARKSLCVVKF
jgi:hypothetical protein